VLIAIGIVVTLLEGIPLPRAGRASLAHPANQRELERWSGIAHAVGIVLSPTELADRLVVVSETMGAEHARWVAPVAPLRRITQTNQRWALFSLADPAPYRMVIEVDRGSGYEPVFRALDAEHGALAAPLHYRRLRGVWNPGSSGPRPAYPHFVTWVAGELFARDPRVAHVRVRYEQFLIPDPGHEPAGSPTTVFAEVRSRPEAP
jgi:hypothetical protein